MYRIGQRYKLQMKNEEQNSKPIFYTAEILDEDDIQIKIKDKHNEEFVLNKSEIKQSKLLGDNDG